VQLKTARAGIDFVLLELSRNLVVEEIHSEDKTLSFSSEQGLGTP